MELSLFYFADESVPGPRPLYDLLLDGARFADEHGLHSVWVPERHFHRFGGLYPNPSVLAAAIAVTTTRVGIRAGSVVAPLHNPLRIAEEWSVVDNLSGGRIGVSFASGWHAQDFVFAPDAYEARKDATIAAVSVVRRLWRGEAIDLVDGGGDTVSVQALPRPVQPELPVWYTSSGNLGTFAAAGGLGAAVLTHLLGQDLAALGGKIDAYREAFVPSPARKDPFVTLMAHAHLGPATDTVRERVREPFTRFLRSAWDLQSSFVGAQDVRREDIDFLVDQAFDRYFLQSGVFGTIDDGRRFLDAAAEAGVDEVACLIDFGTSYEDTMDSLAYLARLRETL